MIVDVLLDVLSRNALITAFAAVGLLVMFSYWLSATLTRGHVHGSAIAIALGLVLAYVGGARTGGSTGLADVGLFDPDDRERVCIRTAESTWLPGLVDGLLGRLRGLDLAGS